MNDTTHSRADGNNESDSTSSSLKRDKITKNTRERLNLSIIGLQVLFVILLIGWSWFYNRIHNLVDWFAYIIHGENIESYLKAIREFNFLGVGVDNPIPSVWAVLTEVTIWSVTGVLVRSEYTLTQIVLKREDISILELISKLIGDCAMGVGLAMAVVAFFWSTEFNIAQMNLTLKTANIATIIAISFILGFYHEDTHRLLGSFQKRISTSSDETQAKTEAKS